MVGEGRIGALGADLEDAGLLDLVEIGAGMAAATASACSAPATISELSHFIFL